MSFASVAEADDALGHVAAWTSRDAGAKQRALDAATLWLGSRYVIGTPTSDALEAVKRAEIVAARVYVDLGDSLFSTPSTGGTQGALTTTKRKVGSLEIEQRWAEPAGSLQSGPVSIPEVDAILRGVLVPLQVATNAGSSVRLVTSL